MAAPLSPRSYSEFLALRREMRTEGRVNPTDDSRAEEAVYALDLAGEYCAARFHGEPPIVAGAFSLLVAGFILWGRR